MTIIALNYGLIGLGIAIVIQTVVFAVMGSEITLENYTSREVIGYLAMLLAFSVVYFGIKSFRDKHADRPLSYWKGVGVGLVISLPPAIGIGIATAALMGFNPEMSNSLFNAQLEAIANSGGPAEEIQTQIAYMESNKALWMNVPFQGFVMFATAFLIGLLISLISSGVLRGRSAAAEMSHTA